MEPRAGLAKIAELPCPPGDVGELRRVAEGSNDVFGTLSDRTDMSVDVDPQR